MTEDLRMTLMLYEDGELSEEESRKVEEYLKEHPDVAEDMLWWEKESATLKKMGVGRLSHEEFKKKIADVVNKDATSNDQSEETADVLPLKKKTFLTNVFTLAAANDNSWMKVAASLLIVAFVGYGLLLPGGTNVKYIALLEQSKGTQKESLDYVLAKSGLVSDGDFLRLLKDPSMRLSITDIGPALVQVKIKNREDGLQTDLSDGDIVQVDDQIKIFVNEIKEDGYLSITHKDSDGKDRKLLSSKKVTRGVPTFALPEKGWWPVTAGKDLETLSFTFSRKVDDPGSIVKRISYLVVGASDTVADADYGSVVANQKDKKGDLLRNDKLSEKFAQLFSLRDSREFLSVFQLATNNASIRTRGVKEQDIYSGLKSSVVKVMTNEGVGAGIIVSADGLIATNYHVVQGYRRLGIKFVPGNSSQIDASKTFFAKVAVVDEIADLALLKIERQIPNLRTAKLAPKGKSTEQHVQIGADVHAIGHPRGLDWTFSSGKVSQIRQKFKWPTGKDKKYIRVADVIQTDTDINPGNSGGPLINDRGEVIGINSFLKGKAQGLNFAIRISEVHRLIGDMKSRKFPRPRTTKKLKNNPKVKSIDANGNGTPELYLVRLGKEKSKTFGMVDKDENGQIDFYIYDINSDGKVEAKIYARYVGTQRIFVWKIDSDGDGKADALGLDLNGDWRPDKIRPIKKMEGKTKALKQYTAGLID